VNGSNGNLNITHFDISIIAGLAVWRSIINFIHVSLDICSMYTDYLILQTFLTKCMHCYLQDRSSMGEDTCTLSER
jgi:hypothetical protein